jgi:hypothetical protein
VTSDSVRLPRAAEEVAEPYGPQRD